MVVRRGGRLAAGSPNFVEYCEQPLQATRAARSRSFPVPIYVDEDCHVLADVERCARTHGINIKLAKSGGIREAVRMAHARRGRSVSA